MHDMNDIATILGWLIIGLVSFFSGAAWGAIRALKITYTVNVHGENVTIKRDLDNGF